MLERWDESTKVTYGRRVLDAFVSLRFVDSAATSWSSVRSASARTFLANALGHLCSRSGYNVRILRADALLRMLKQSRMDNSGDAVLTELDTVDVLIIDACRSSTTSHCSR